MKTAFYSLKGYCPAGFKLKVVDNNNFITLCAEENSFMKLLDEDKRRAVEYMVKVKEALEANGAVVLLVREGGVEL